MTTGDIVEERRSLSWERVTGSMAILQEDGFRRLWLGRLFSHTALNAALFTLLILAVGDGTGASIKSALFITAYLLPTAALATVSGVLVDRLPKNLLLAGLNLGRLGLMMILLMAETDIWTVYAIALFLAVVSQFAAPAEAAALPQVVRPDQLTTANSTSNLGGLISQMVGFAVLPPLFLNLGVVGTRPLFFICGALFGLAAFFFLSIRSLGEHRVDLDSTVDAVREVRERFAQAWETLKGDLGAYMSVIIFVLASTTSLVGVTLMARFVEGTLGIPVRNAIFVFLPAAIGILAGLRLVQWLEHRLPRGLLVGGGFGLLMAAFAGLALTPFFGAILEDMNPLGLFAPGPFGDTSARIVVTVVFSTIAAFAFSVVGVTTRSLVNSRMPLEIQGRVFAAQFVLTNLASIPPILLAGLLAAAFGVGPVLIVFVAAMVAVAAWTAAQAVVRSRSMDDAQAA